MWRGDRNLKLFIAATSSMRKRPDIVRQSKYLLESFYTIADWQIPLIHEADMFLLDSGAFTFMGSKKGQKIDFDKYLDDYIEFINKYDVKYFFELDIDSVVGYPKVLEMRKKLERETGKKCIPVWHESRGVEEWKRLCEDYEYIAVGGFAIKDIKKSEFPMIKQLVKYARSKGVKVHGLGYTQQDVKEWGFYSADSSSYASGARFCRIGKFKNGKIKYEDHKGVKNSQDLNSVSLVESLSSQLLMFFRTFLVRFTAMTGAEKRVIWHFG